MSSGLAAPSLPPTPEEPPPPARGTRLPRPFLRSLRTLFEILDDQRSGTVHVSEIESRWGRGGCGVSPPGDSERCPLPGGVLQALQQVAEPCGGYLSFPRLVAGLRIALLRAEEEEEKEVEKAGESGAGVGGQAGDGQNSTSQSMKNLSRIRESDGKGVTRSRSINSSLCQAGRRRSIRLPKEPRRHTISNALEYDMLKRMQELERERDALLQGLEMVERVRDWFQRHLLEAQRRQKHMGTEASYFPDPYSNQSCLLLAKIQEVNLCLKNLLASPGKPEVPPPGFGGPLYPPGKKEFQQQAVTVLKEQNHLLIKEVSEKSDRIAQLEQEKAALCKQLKETRGYRLPSHKESTFI
ncbi:suppressor APC domain-containing protein 1 isoform X1 [Podarcis muralis]|uniref:suppressor APC domain-containing protein 2-like isoform X1 n=1 Tax=Podarcis muralis TaxID=64176 RepID=UPI0010A0A7C5|nr:suppressor APC domain-containing protein 2-like isoform X1 [Podarcis muralis]